MSESRAHKTTANRIADKLNTDYNQGQGADVQTPQIAIEVETPETVADAGRQLRGHRKPVYVAVTTQEGVKKALDYYKDTTIGVMNSQGKIVKKSTRGS